MYDESESAGARPPRGEADEMIAVLFMLTIVGLFIYAAAKRPSVGQPGVSPATLELTSVRDALIEKHGWSLERADAARREYIRFLTLLQKKPGFMLVPWLTVDGRDDLDQFWHQHILDTAKYAADCNLLFGRMIHHNPHVVRGSEQETTAFEKTQRLYARTFGEGTYGEPVDALLLTGCGACATADSHSSSQGAHGDSGHGGGHSCGGHSCGHGCGHGCGGH
jgi:hypothetical protein